LIPIKCLSFGEAVNVTLGLPFIRTSVITALLSTLPGKVSPIIQSMVAAIKLAIELTQRRLPALRFSSHFSLSVGLSEKMDWNPAL
jgi:4-hydroxy-L-threonine phosphate dehydrogenase PdxA